MRVESHVAEISAEQKYTKRYIRIISFSRSLRVLRSCVPSHGEIDERQGAGRLFYDLCNVCRTANEIVDIAKLVLLSLLMAFYLNTGTRARADRRVAL